MAYTPKSTIHGLPEGQITWSSDFQANRDDKQKWTGSESFTCRLTDATSLIPANGADCQLPGWSFMKVSGVKVTNLEGDLCQVTCEYGGFQEGDEPSEETTSYTYELGITTREEPIETNYRYRTVSADELQIIQNLKSGKLKPVKDASYKYTSASDHEQGTVFEVSSDLGKELADYIQKGVEAYLLPGQIWRASFVSNNPPSASILNSVGKITSAINAPGVGAGRNWLFIGCNASQTGEVFSITYEWMLSGQGGWDSNLYANS